VLFPGKRARQVIDASVPSGTVVVTNPTQGVWDSASNWRVSEDLRIGTLEGTGPDLFGQIDALEVDRDGRIWVLEVQAQELRVFGRDGRAHRGGAYLQ
jgi:sugar lactone lactonase YvrE